MLISPSDYSGVGEIDQDQVVLKAALSMLGGGFLQIGLVVWLAGYIVNAISFLPGRED
jgi:di/tricarboxylate transporter